MSYVQPAMDSSTNHKLSVQEGKASSGVSMNTWGEVYGLYHLEHMSVFDAMSGHTNFRGGDFAFLGVYFSLRGWNDPPKG